MMSSGHALSGAASGYVSCLTASFVTGYEFHWAVPHVIAAVCAGWALWPDCDTLKSTVSTSLGFITRSMHELVCWICAAVFYSTATEADLKRGPVIHRGATHTWPGAVVMGLLVGVLCLAWPRWAVPIVLGISLHWALRGLAIPSAPHGKPKGNIIGRWLTTSAYAVMGALPTPGKLYRWGLRKSMRMIGLSGKMIRTASIIVCLVGSWLVTEATPELATRWAALLGACVVQGIIVHMLGDSITESGICWRFPFKHPVTGRRWQASKIPSWTVPAWVPIWKGRVVKPAFKTGRWFEVGIMYPVCIGAILIAMPGGYALVLHVIAAWRDARFAAAALPFAPWPTTKTPALQSQ